MAQRVSGYVREPDDVYPTPPWVTRAVVPYLKGVKKILEAAPGRERRMVKTLREAGFQVIPARGDFLASDRNHVAVDCIATNPPFGPRGKLAVQFIEQALELTRQSRGRVAMLLKVDFDSGKTRRHLFGDCQAFALKLVLLDRIVWFEPKLARPSDNHAWFVWNWRHEGPPTIVYGP